MAWGSQRITGKISGWTGKLSKSIQDLIFQALCSTVSEEHFDTFPVLEREEHMSTAEDCINCGVK